MEGSCSGEGEDQPGATMQGKVPETLLWTRVTCTEAHGLLTGRGSSETLPKEAVCRFKYK